MLVRSKAPLRLGLAGGGTDVSPYSDDFGGYVLNATINLFAFCTIEVLDEPKIIFCATDINQRFETGLTDFIDPRDNLVLHKGVYNRIIKEFNGGEPLALKITTYSDAPAGSGLGSSSTMVVAMIKAFVELLNLPLGEYDIAQLAYQVERIEIGLSGGKQDQYAATFGGFNFIEFYSGERVIVNPLRIKNWIINELEASMVLYYTGTSRESARIIDEQAKNAKLKLKTSLEAMHELKTDAVIMKEHILKGNIKGFAEYLGKSWESKKRTASAVTNQYIDKVYEVAMDAGAYAGKVSGAGGGGFMMFITDPVDKPKVIERLNGFHGEGKVVNFHFTKDGTQAWRI